MNFLAATAGDAPQIAALLTAVWPEETADLHQIGRVLSTPTQTTLLAWQNGRLVGLVSGFMVQSRWQVDLLAVAAAARGQGVGRTLIQHSVAAGQAHGCTFAEGIIQEGNIGSEKAFAAAGFAASSGPHHLWLTQCAVWPAVVRRFRPVWVETLTYGGVWLEAGESDHQAQLAQPTQLSAVLPSGHEAEPALAAAGFEPVGRYTRWHKTL